MINLENILVLVILIYCIVSVLLIDRYKKKISELEKRIEK